MIATTEIVDGGWVVTHSDQKGQSFYMGRDMYWTRVKQAAQPFKTQAAAIAAADVVNDKRRAQWE